MYGIASNSKFFASISVGLLIEDGTKLRNGQKLGYDTKMKDIFPEWNMSDPIANDLVDVTDLLGEHSKSLSRSRLILTGSHALGDAKTRCCHWVSPSFL